MIAGLVVLAVVGPASAWWAWRFQRRVLRVLRHRTSWPVSGREIETALVAPLASPAAVGTASAPARVAVRHLERTTGRDPASVLGWDAFALVSWLVLDGTVLLACQRQADGPSQTVAPEQATLVLLIGDDARSRLAVAVLEAWRRTEATLRLRPTAVAGAIEVCDGHRRAIRAALLAD